MAGVDRWHLAVLTSGRGSNLEAVIRHSQADPDCPYEVTRVIADRPCYALERAAAHGIAMTSLDRKAPDFQERLRRQLQGFDLIVLAGFLSILSPQIIADHPGRILNIHPSLLPRHGGVGMHGLYVHEAVIDAGDAVSGCSAHLVTEAVDQGPVVVQKTVTVQPDDTPQTLQARILPLEHEVLVAAILKLWAGSADNQLIKEAKMPMNALISVYDKEGALELAHFLEARGFTILSSGGTARYLQEAGIAVRGVDTITGFPEILDGRVKTLHPRIHGGILARRDLPSHMETLAEQQIEPIDVVCVNLYPFEKKLGENLAFEEMIEFIDIGGPSMLRSAAKNFDHVYVLTDPVQYAPFMEQYGAGADLAAFRKKLALEVFRRTSAYDASIARWLAGESAKSVNPDHLTLELDKLADLRYGENPHQTGAFYGIPGKPGFMTTFIQHHGKEFGFINYKDLEAAWRIVSAFTEPACAAVKHNTPCGVALGSDAAQAYQRAFDCDPLSIFGGIVAVNRPLDVATARLMSQTMLHIVCAPAYSEEALAILRQKKTLIVVEMTQTPTDEPSLVSCGGGILLQTEDQSEAEAYRVVTKAVPTEAEMAELRFAWRVVKFVKSNAIVVTHHRAALGIGGGFVNRIDAARYALEHGDGASCLASDAFFPFPDVVEEAHRHGIRAIIQPGGSLKDEESIRRCDELGIAMVFTGMRHFRH